MTWNAALVFSYGVPIPGRESPAMENFANAQKYFQRLAADGKCAEPEIFHTGYGGGMMILKGTSRTALAELLDLEESQKLLLAATLTSTNFRYELYLTGDDLADSMVRYAGAASELGYM